MRAKSRSRPGVVLLATAVACALAAGCRSDGGIDRHDCAHSLDFAASRVVRKTAEDAKDTAETIAAIPENAGRSFGEGWRAVRRTYYLYLETHQPDR